MAGSVRCASPACRLEPTCMDPKSGSSEEFYWVVRDGKFGCRKRISYPPLPWEPIFSVLPTGQGRGRVRPREFWWRNYELALEQSVFLVGQNLGGQIA